MNVQRKAIAAALERERQLLATIGGAQGYSYYGSHRRGSTTRRRRRRRVRVRISITINVRVRRRRRGRS